MNIFIDPQIYELLGFKGIAAIFVLPLVIMFIAAIVWLPAGAIPYFLAALAATVGIVWLGTRKFDDWYYVE